MSDWLSIIIVILIVGILLDGFRRARMKRKNTLVLSKNARKYDLMFEQEDELAENAKKHEPVSERKVESDPNSESLIPEQKSLDLDEPVPMLMETYEDSEQQISEREHSDDIELDTEAPAMDLDEEKGAASTKNSELDGDQSEPPAEYQRAHQHKHAVGHVEPTLGDLDDVDEALDDDDATSSTDSVRELESDLDDALNHSAPSTESKKANAEPEELLVINVLAKSGERIDGAKLLQALSFEGLKYGDMQIFHRHLNNDGDAASLYSIAKIVEPGSFDLVDVDTNTTPGICIFLPLPCVGSALEAYEDMVLTAKNLSGSLHCDLVDENRSALTNQTIEHGRQRVIEFERRKKLQQHSQTSPQ